LKTSQRAPASANFASSAPNSSLYYHHSAARIAENGFATSSSVSKSAKVVLGRVLIIATDRQATTDVRFAFITGGKADIPQGRVRAKNGHWPASFDDLVRYQLHRVGDRNSECRRSSEINDQLKLRRLLDRQVAGLLAFEN